MRILISPLDWGLGHATRCIPIIKCFLQNGCNVYVACNTTQQRLLEKEFSNIVFLPLAGYNIRYASSKRWFAAKILQQIPKILLSIYNEYRWLKKAVIKYQIDVIISDNRYGFYHKKIPSVFITHQLFIQTPSVLLSHWVQTINYRFINRFQECWVPDYEGKINLAGVLSHPKQLPAIPVTYLGNLSRFKVSEQKEKKYKWLVVLSGPEPHRTLLENELAKIFSQQSATVLLIRGLPSNNATIALPANFIVYNHLQTKQLNEALLQSEFVISRSGYTTVMELISLQKKSVLIPTPGQTEQEYLATHLHEQGWCLACHSVQQLSQCMQQAVKFTYQMPQLLTTDLDVTVKRLLKKYSR